MSPRSVLLGIVACAALGIFSGLYIIHVSWLVKALPIVGAAVCAAGAALGWRGGLAGRAAAVVLAAALELTCAVATGHLVTYTVAQAALAAARGGRKSFTAMGYTFHDSLRVESTKPGVVARYVSRDSWFGFEVSFVGGKYCVELFD